MSELQKIAVVVSHPIQHFCPQYASFAENKNIKFKVFFASKLGLEKYVDPNFNQEIKWANLYLEKFDHYFLNGDQVLPSSKNLDSENLEVHLDEYQPDLVIIYGYFQKLQRRAYRWSHRNNVKIAYISDSELRQKRPLLNRLLIKPFLYWYFSRIHLFLSVGDSNEEYYKVNGVPRRKILRMHFPIDIETFKTVKHKRQFFNEQVRESLQIPSNSVVLSVVGKLVSWKSQAHIIEAMKILEGRNCYLHLLIIGSGPEEQQLKAEATLLTKSRVHFTGFVTPDQLPLFYSATDIYVHPAAIEPHSLAISEAIYMNCPVILSDRCGSYGATDDVQPHRNGLVFKYGNCEELANSIEILMKNEDMRYSFSALSGRIGEDFQQQAHFNVVEQLIEKIK